MNECLSSPSISRTWKIRTWLRSVGRRVSACSVSTSVPPPQALLSPVTEKRLNVSFVSLFTSISSSPTPPALKAHNHPATSHRNKPRESHLLHPRSRFAVLSTRRPPRIPPHKLAARRPKIYPPLRRISEIPRLLLRPSRRTKHLHRPRNYR